MTDLFDAAESREARDRAMAQVLTHNPKWSELLLAFIEGLPRGWRGKAEDIRMLWKGPQPDHPNAWGALVNIAVKQNLLEASGPPEAMASKRSHARKTAVYRRT